MRILFQSTERLLHNFYTIFSFQGVSLSISKYGSYFFKNILSIKMSEYKCDIIHTLKLYELLSGNLLIFEWEVM